MPRAPICCLLEPSHLEGERDAFFGSHASGVTLENDTQLVHHLQQLKGKGKGKGKVSIFSPFFSVSPAL